MDLEGCKADEHAESGPVNDGVAADIFVFEVVEEGKEVDAEKAEGTGDDERIRAVSQLSRPPGRLDEHALDE